MSAIIPHQKWFVIRDGVRAALLENPRQEDMFWFSYDVTALPEAREPVHAPEFWRDDFDVEDASSGFRMAHVFAGEVQPRSQGERVWLRGLRPYRAQPTPPPSWARRSWRRLSSFVNRRK